MIRLEDLGEHEALLEDLADQYELCQKAEKEAKKRKATIKKTVIEILNLLGQKEERVVAPLSIGKAWDRRISRKGGGLSDELLEDQLGTEVYRKLCDREVRYVLNQVKLDNARQKGRITEKQLRKAMVEPELGDSLYLPKVEDVDDVDKAG